MKRINYLLILAVLTFVSCGKSDKELQAERQAQKLAEREAYQKAYKIAVMSYNGLPSGVSIEG